MVWDLLSFGSLQNHDLLDELFVSGFEKEIKSCVSNIGGPAKACLLLNMKHTRLKEWLSGRRPIPLSFLISLAKLGGRFKQVKVMFDSRDIALGCRYSNHKVKIPKAITEQLSYIVGVILGDGCLAGKKEKKQNWAVITCFDNEAHCKLFCDYVHAIFGITAKKRYPGRGYIEVAIYSKVVYWFLNEFFEIKDGVKHDSIRVPNVLKTKGKAIIAALIRGLFDSDGTIVPSRKTVSFSSTSKKIVEELKPIMEGFGIYGGIYCWVKKGGFKPLYSLRFYSKKYVLAFKNRIGFAHPAKKEKLKRLCSTFYSN